MPIFDAHHGGRVLTALCLADNDVILKLAVCDLLDDALLALSVEKSNVYLTSPAHYSLKSQIKKYESSIQSRVLNFLSQVRLIDWEIQPDEQLLFEDIMGIDFGEAILFSATARLTDFILITGDKVSLRALASSPECDHIVRRLAGRVVCLEQLIQQCISHHGFDLVKNKIVPARDCDIALNSIFGSGLMATLNSVNDGLNSYVNHLRAEVGCILSLLSQVK